MEFELIHNVYRAGPLARFDWLEHGFGNRLEEPPGSLATLRQIHSDTVVYAYRQGCFGEGDALLSDTPGLRVGVKTADCLPILLADERHRAVAAVHAGWRGCVSLIAQKTVEAMAARWNTRPGDVHAAIGPGIGLCCFEVGPEVAVHFGIDRRTRINLEQTVRLQLTAAGIAPRRIYACGLCTLCNPGQFHSFRRDGGKAGRMVSVIGVKSPPRNS